MREAPISVASQPPMPWRRARYWAIRSSLAVALLSGVLAAIGYVSINRAPGETGLAAIGFLETGSLANPYLLPTGPTAHVSPLHGLLIAAIYAVFGVNSDLARIVLSLASCGAYLGCVVMAIRFCRRLEFPALAVVLLASCLLPFTLFEAVVQWRQWDQPYAALLLMAAFTVCASQPGRPGPGRIPQDLSLAVLVGVACLTSPSVAPAILVGWGLVLWRSRRDARTRFKAFRSLLVMIILVLPWGLRNKAELGALIFTRSNFGLELAVGNTDGADGRSPLNIVIHPHDSETAARRVQVIGEVAYMAEMSKLARTWIGEHPQHFIELTLARLRLILLPPADFVGWLPLGAAWAAGLVLVLLNLAKLGSLTAAVFRRDRPVMWVAFCLLPLLPYATTHVSLRYLYPVFFPSLCLIAECVNRLAARKEIDAV